MLTCWLTNLPCAATSCRSSAISSRRLASPGSAGALCRATLPILCTPLVLWLKEAARATCLLPRWLTEACSAKQTFTYMLDAQCQRLGGIFWDLDNAGRVRSPYPNSQLLSCQKRAREL